MRSRSILRTTNQRRRLLAAALALVAVGLFTAAAATAFHKETDPRLRRDLPPPSQAESARALTGPSATSASRRATPRRRQLAVPVRIRIRAIGVSASVIPLHLEHDGTLQVPNDFAQTGWFVGGPEPGEPGAAVVAGHVDSKRGPAAFYRLRALVRGDVVRLTLRDGTVVRFVVNGTRAVPKKHFPWRLVYRKTRRPTLRLITCDGVFNSATGHYVDNYIVFAKLLSIWDTR